MGEMVSCTSCIMNFMPITITFVMGNNNAGINYLKTNP